MSRSRQAKAREFNARARKEIIKRDRGECIFCAMGYRMEGGPEFAKEIKGIMHYIPRSKNGLGIPQNGGLGCQYHHEMMDNGNRGFRGEMLEIFKEYLKSHYPGWDERELVYSKWGFLEGGEA